MNSSKKSYYAIIPANVRYDKNIRPNAKLLYGEITALCNEKGFCWANNQYFAELYEVSKTSISLWIKELVDNDYISTELIYKEGSKEILHRYLRIVNDPTQQKLNTPPQQKLKDNTTSFNTTINNKGDKTSTTLMEDFEKLWKLYPNKKGPKKKAYASYCRAIKNGTTNKQIQDGILKYKKYLEVEDWQKPAHGSTWFSNERWEDDYAVEVVNSRRVNVLDKLKELE